VPESQVIYADNDPLVLVHARALLTSRPEGACAYADADVRDPGRILEAAAGRLDFSGDPPRLPRRPPDRHYPL
jgi:S-adenosyl methyltransferase